jgi:hypothetical protein
MNIQSRYRYYRIRNNEVHSLRKIENNLANSRIQEKHLIQTWLLHSFIHFFASCFNLLSAVRRRKLGSGSFSLKNERCNAPI